MGTRKDGIIKTAAEGRALTKYSRRKDDGGGVIRFTNGLVGRTFEE